MAKISAVEAMEILDSRGNPTVAVRVRLEDGSIGSAAVPSGASTGGSEAVELRDGGERYGGKGVRTAVRNIETEIRDRIIGTEADDQTAIDEAIIDLDGTPDKSWLGANALLGASLAVAHAAAASSATPLYRHLERLYGTPASAGGFPVPMFNIINGGEHSDSGLSVQEFKVVPYGIEGYPERLRAGSEIFHALKGILAKDGWSIGVGDEGGFAPRLESHEQAFELILEAVRAAGYEPGQDIVLAVDVAANTFYDASSDQYVLKPEGVTLSRESLINLYREWMAKFSVVSVEDGLREEDWEGWPTMREKLERESAAWAKPPMLIGDDFLVTDPKRVKRAIDAKACNAVLIKPNQIGTLTETLRCVRLARDHELETVVSHRSGETCDTTIADLAVATGSGFIKTGSLSRGERLAKYNRLLEIWWETRTA